MSTPITQTRGTPLQGLFGATLGFFVGFAAVSLFGPTVDYLEKAAALTPAMAGLLIAVPNLSGSLLRIPFSAMVDTTGGRKPFLILLVLSIIGLAGIEVIVRFGAGRLQELFPLLLFFGILGGAGSATFSVGISQTSYWFPARRQGSALGAFAGIGNLAPGIFAFLLSAFALPTFGLAGSYLLWLGILILGTALYALFGRNAWFFQFRSAGLSEEEAKAAARDKGQEFFPKSRVTESLKASAGVWQTWALVAIYFTSFGGFMALTGWFPKYWLSYHGVSLAVAGSLTALYSITASAVRVAGGSVSDRFGGERTAFFSLLVTMIGAIGVAFSQGVPPAIASVVLMALGMGTANAAVFKLVPQMVPDAIGGAAGWVGGLGAFGGFVIPNVMAAFVSGGGVRNRGYALGFLVFVALAALSMALVGLLSRKGQIKKQLAQGEPA